MGEQVVVGRPQSRTSRAVPLTAIALQTGRPKDRERVIRLLEEECLDKGLLTVILEKHGLTDKFMKLMGVGHEKESFPASWPSGHKETQVSATIPPLLSIV